MTERMVEITFEIPASEAAVLDGFCHAMLLKRGTQLRKIVGEWSAVERHKAIMICRVAGINPTAPGPTPAPSGADMFGPEQTRERT